MLVMVAMFVMDSFRLGLAQFGDVDDVVDVGTDDDVGLSN